MKKYLMGVAAAALISLLPQVATAVGTPARWQAITSV